LSSIQDLKKITRKFGFQRDREGVITRYLNEKENWASHITNTKNFILESSSDKAKGICLILGSGWWLDLPVDELNELFDVLIFVDVTHPPQIIQKVKSYPKFVLLEHDVTGILKTLIPYKRFSDLDFFQKLSGKAVFDFYNCLKPDFIISSNILSQLSYFPKRYVSQRTNYPEVVQIITKSVETEHLKFLQNHKSCLITDYYQYEYIQKDKILNESQRLTIKLPEIHIKKEWIWDFDQKGNFINNRKVMFKVAALQF
jgi:hypothetical protein